jgi:hypothetical protein
MGRLIAITFLLLSTGRTAQAASSIEWRAPAGCPDTASLRARVESRLERSLDDVAIDISIDVTKSHGRYTARVDLGAVTVANDVRTLTSTRCSELADAVAVIVARVANDAARRAVEADAVDVEAIVIHPLPTAMVARPVAPAFVDRGEPAGQGAGAFRPWTIGARVSGLSGIGLIPQVGLGAEVAVTVRAGRHLAELGRARWARSTAQFIIDGPRNIDVNLDVTVARYGWRNPTLPLRAWLAVEVGNMHGGGLAVTQIDDDRWIAAGAGFGIAWQMTDWIRLFGSTEAMAAIERARFTNGDMVVYAPSPLSVRTTCGLEVGWQ